jgi:cation-transporting P-type ATPase C
MSPYGFGALSAYKSVVTGDTVVVAAGAVVPVDGTVLSGHANVNEAALTGESAPVPKTRGSNVMSGSIIQEGRLAIYAEHVGNETITARIAEYVERSLAVKGQTQMESARLADRLVPTVLSVAGGSFLTSGDWRRPASVLQADYSCALKLATPIAFKFAMYGAGTSGILVKGADALERLAEADTFLFDKTGTLTTGSLQVVDAIAFDASFSPDDLICLAASVEEHYSYHPLAMAVVEAARSTTHNRHFDHQEVEFIVAHGVASVIEGKRIVVGSRHFVEDDEGIDFSEHWSVIDRLHKKAGRCSASGSAASCSGCSV